MTSHASPPEPRWTSSPDPRGILWALLSAGLFGTLSIGGRWVLRSGAGPLTVVAARATLAAVTLGLALLLFRRPLLRISWRDLPFFVLFGLTSAALNYLAYFTALHHLGAILATTLFYTYPAMAALLAAIFLKEPLSWSKAFPILVTVFGCALVAGLFGPAEYALQPAGVLWALVAAATAAAYPIFGRRAMARHSPWTTLFYSIALGSLFLDLFWTGQCVLFSGGGELCGAQPTFTQASAVFWGGALYLAIGPTLGGYMTYLLSIRRLEVRQASLVTATELIVAALLAYLYLGERPTTPQWIGGALILVAVLWVRLERAFPGHWASLKASDR